MPNMPYARPYPFLWKMAMLRTMCKDGGTCCALYSTPHLPVTKRQGKAHLGDCASACPPSQRIIVGVWPQRSS